VECGDPAGSADGWATATTGRVAAMMRASK
jgi:hypothetical protein